MSTKVVVVKNATLWPWKVDRKKPADERQEDRAPKAIVLSTRKTEREKQKQRKLKPITKMVRNKDGRVSEHKVKTLISNLEQMLQEK
jgi:hypothetical protein